MIETKGVEDKKNAANPVKAAAKAAEKAAAKEAAREANANFVETRIWEENPFKRKESELQKKIDAFIKRCYESEGLDENVHCLSKRRVKKLLHNFMNESKEGEAWNDK